MSNSTETTAVLGPVERPVRPPFRPTQAHMAAMWMSQRRQIPAYSGWVFNPFSGWWTERPNV